MTKQCLSFNRVWLNLLWKTQTYQQINHFIKNVLFFLDLYNHPFEKCFFIVEHHTTVVCVMCGAGSLCSIRHGPPPGSDQWLDLVLGLLNVGRAYWTYDLWPCTTPLNRSLCVGVINTLNEAKPSHYLKPAPPPTDLMLNLPAGSNRNKVPRQDRVVFFGALTDIYSCLLMLGEAMQISYQTTNWLTCSSVKCIRANAGT